MRVAPPAAGLRMKTFSHIQRRALKIGGEFRLLWKHYIYQSFFAALTLALVILVLNVEHAVIVASIGATAFIVFTMPRNITAKPRRVIGGHIVGLVCGSLVSLIPHSMLLFSIMVYSLAVGLSIFMMVALDFEHPPASGTALGVAISGFSLDIMLAVVTGSILLSLAHRFLRRYLRDLT